MSVAEAVDEVLQALADPDFHPDRPKSIVHVQTHVSHVFVGDRFTWKMKKPVRFSFADFSTLAARRACCEDEVRLNRRLCPSIYLGTAGVVRDRDGRLRLDDGSEPIPGASPVEPLVRMRTLPADGMGHRALVSGRLDRGRLERLARSVAAFHASLPPEPANSPACDPAAIVRRWQDVIDDARPLRGGAFDGLRRAVLEPFARLFVSRREDAFLARALAGRVREGHGDLHLGNLCLVSPGLPALAGAPAVPEGVYAFDCIEFSRPLRTNDVAAEIAFLAMDLEADGRPDLARAFVRAYVEASGDGGVEELVPYFVAHFALVRGMVLGVESLQPEVAEDERRTAADGSKAHFELASRAAWRALGPTVLACTGLSGSGKSHVAAALAEASGFDRLSTDELRKRSAGLDPAAPAPAASREALYSAAARHETYRRLVAEARAQLAAGRSVVLDATFNDRSDRDLVVALAREAGAACLFVECVLDDERARARLAARARAPRAGVRSDADFEVRLAQARERVPLGPDEPGVAVDTSGDPDRTAAVAVGAAVEALVRRAPPA